jgi:hypothetical protein
MATAGRFLTIKEVVASAPNGQPTAKDEVIRIRLCTYYLQFDMPPRSSL